MHVLRERCRVYSVSVHYVCHAMAYPQVRKAFICSKIIRLTMRNLIHKNKKTIESIFVILVADL